MRLVDADKLITVFAERKEVWRGNGVLPSNESLMWLAAMDITSNAPTVDAAPVKHGRWELFDSAEPQRYGCSNCSCLSWYGTYRYCPNCGSRMDLEEQDAQLEQSGK